MLKEVDYLGKEQVAELVAFGRGLFGINGRPGMMSDVLREVAQRFIFLTGAVKLTIEIPSWDDEGHFETLEVDAAYLDDLSIVEECVGTKMFKIIGFHHPIIDYYIENINMTMKIDEVLKIEESIEMLNLAELNLKKRERNLGKISLKKKEWGGEKRFL